MEKLFDIRRVDELGRFVLPEKIRQALGNKLTIYREEQFIMLEKAEPNSKGLICEVNEVGFVIIPTEIRQELNINEKDPLEIYTEGSVIRLRKHEQGCTFCGCDKDQGVELTDFMGKRVCDKCFKRLAEIMRIGKKNGEF